MPPVRIVRAKATGTWEDIPNAFKHESPADAAESVFQATPAGKIICAVVTVIVFLAYTIALGVLYATTNPTWFHTKVHYANFATLNNVSMPATNPVYTPLMLQWAIIGTFITVLLVNALHLLRVVFAPTVVDKDDNDKPAPPEKQKPHQRMYGADSNLLLTTLLTMPLFGAILLGIQGDDDFAAQWFMAWTVVAFYSIMFAFQNLLHTTMNLRVEVTNAQELQKDIQKGRSLGGRSVGLRETVAWVGALLPTLLLVSIWVALVWQYWQIISNNGKYDPRVAASLWIFLASVLLSWLMYMGIVIGPLFGLFISRVVDDISETSQTLMGETKRAPTLASTGMLHSHMWLDMDWFRFFVGALPYLQIYVVDGVIAFCLLSFYQSNTVGIN
jgi:hypothetical protein